MSICENVKNLIDEINILSDEILIIGASKTRTIDEIIEAKNSGIEFFAENRVQEFVEKFGKVDVRWHFIGQLQTNKAKFIVGNVEIIHAVDNVKLADEISKLAIKKKVIQEILIEINIGQEESKGGVSQDDFELLYQHCLKLPNIKVIGIMTVMPKFAPKELYLRIKQIYDKLKKRNNEIRYLSVGMSDDFATAIECGANVVRIGTKIFGARRVNE